MIYEKGPGEYLLFNNWTQDLLNFKIISIYRYFNGYKLISIYPATIVNVWYLFIWAFFCRVFSIVLYLVTNFIAFNRILSLRKESPFECGFDPKDSARTSFSIRFFLIAVIFLIFDIEVVLLIPFVISIQRIITCYVAGFSFIVVLLVGLYHEWRLGALRWIEWTFNKKLLTF